MLKFFFPNSCSLALTPFFHTVSGMVIDFVTIFISNCFDKNNKIFNVYYIYIAYIFGDVPKVCYIAPELKQTLIMEYLTPTRLVCKFVVHIWADTYEGKETIYISLN